VKLLDHDNARDAVMRYPNIASRLPEGWLDRCSRRGQVVDAHRVYRMLATGGVGWGDSELQQLEQLIARLRERQPGIDGKINELWNADENRIDSLATELLAADALLAGGHALTIEPAVGTSRPEYFIDGTVLMEVKTYCQRKSETPMARLKFEITHKVDSGCSLELQEVTGLLTANHVGPLVKQLAHRFDRSRAPGPGVRHIVAHDGVSLTIEATHRYPELTAGSFLTMVGSVIVPAEAAEDGEAWLLDSAKEAAGQMKAFSGPKIVVLDVSQCRSLTDGMALSPSLCEQLRRRTQAKHPNLVPVIALRQSNFGGLCCTPNLSTEVRRMSAGR
jgi:hypothetical protein